LPLARPIVQNDALSLFDSFYRSGSLVFGGGHVVLPLLQAEVVPPGWVTDDQFLAGYGAAQAVPGPLFTFAAYLGAVRRVEPNGWLGAAIALVGIFLPAFLIVLGSLPYWERLRKRTDAQAVLRGVNAAVVGLLLAALYQPVWTSAIDNAGDLEALTLLGAAKELCRVERHSRHAEDSSPLATPGTLPATAPERGRSVYSIRRYRPSL